MFVYIYIYVCVIFLQIRSIIHVQINFSLFNTQIIREPTFIVKQSNHSDIPKQNVKVSRLSPCFHSPGQSMSAMYMPMYIGHQHMEIFACRFSWPVSLFATMTSVCRQTIVYLATPLLMNIQIVLFIFFCSLCRHLCSPIYFFSENLSGPPRPSLCTLSVFCNTCASPPPGSTTICLSAPPPQVINQVTY